MLATGAEPLTLPGTEGVPGVHLLRTLDDAARLRPVLAAAPATVVVGAGWIGAEFATAAREAGCAVTVVEAADRVLAGALPAEVAEPMARWYEEAGAGLITGAKVAGIEEGRVLLADGRALAVARSSWASARAPPRDGWPGPVWNWARTARSPPTPTCAPPCPGCTRSATAPPSPPGGTGSGCSCTTGTTRSRGRGRWRRTSWPGPGPG